MWSSKKSMKMNINIINKKMNITPTLQRMKIMIINKMKITKNKIMIIIILRCPHMNKLMNTKNRIIKKMLKRIIMKKKIKTLNQFLVMINIKNMKDNKIMIIKVGKKIKINNKQI